MAESTLPTYQVRVFDKETKNFEYACLAAATQTDLPSADSEGWTCFWQEIWQVADFDCQAIIKFSHQERVLGLMRLSLYPYTGTGTAPEFLFIDNLEAKRKRTVDPVGLWLIWYATKLSLQYCTGNKRGSVLKLDSYPETIPYYRDKVMMSEIGWTCGAPGEDVYAFQFTKDEARAFCLRTEQKFGSPVL